MKVGRHVFSCRSLLLSTTVLNDNKLGIKGMDSVQMIVFQAVSVIQLRLHAKAGFINLSWNLLAHCGCIQHLGTFCVTTFPFWSKVTVCGVA